MLSYLCHVSFLLAVYVCSTKIGENSDITKCFENFVYQELGLPARFYAAELRSNININNVETELKNLGVISSF